MANFEGTTCAMLNTSRGGGFVCVCVCCVGWFGVFVWGVVWCKGSVLRVLLLPLRRTSLLAAPFIHWVGDLKGHMSESLPSAKKPKARRIVFCFCFVFLSFSHSHSSFRAQILATFFPLPFGSCFGATWQKRGRGISHAMGFGFFPSASARKTLGFLGRQGKSAGFFPSIPNKKWLRVE